MKSLIKIFLLSIVILSPTAFVQAADTYVIDTKGAHAFVQFRIKHLGYSWLYGRFNDFSGEFTYDASDDSKNSVSASVDITSLDSNHAERDKHLRAKKYLNSDKFSSASFQSTQYETVSEGKAKLTGELTLMGKTQTLVLDLEVIGGGEDPWGGYRQGFEARATIDPKDYGMKASIGQVELVWSVEGIRK